MSGPLVALWVIAAIATLVVLSRQRRAHRQTAEELGRANRALAAMARVSADLEEAERRSRLGADHARRHLALLAQGSRALVASVDDEAAALRSLAAVIVPEFADWCAIDVVKGGGVQRLAAVHREPEADELVADLLAELPGWAAPVRRVMATGHSELVWDVATPPDHLEDADHVALARALGLRSCLVVPIRIQGLSVGAITCATTADRRGYRPSDVAAVEELAARTALTMERMSLYRETERAAAEAAGRAGQLRRLTEAALAVQPGHSSHDVAGVIARQACRVLGTPDALVSLRGDARTEPVRVAAGGQWTEQHGRLMKRAEEVRPGPVSAVIDPDTGTVDAVAARLNDHDGNPMGMLVVTAAAADPLSDDDQSILVALAQLASVALDNARLYESVRAGEERLLALVEAAPLAIMELDLDARPQRCNTAALRLLGGQSGTTTGVTFHPQTTGLLQRLVADTVTGKPVSDVEAVVWHTDGAELPVSLAGAPLRHAGGAVDGVLVIAADLTARRRLEEQVVRARRIEAVGQVAGGVAHDFNNLLTVILGHATLLAATLPADDFRRSDVEAISMAAERAAGVTAQLLTISRGDLVSTEVFDPRERLRRMADTVRSLLPASVELRVDAGSGDALVRMSPAQFDQAVLNLAVNARDAMSAGGSLTLRLADAGGAVVLEVSDTGAGMDAATAERCFEAFFTTKGGAGGTGLGLATVHSVVTGAGGQVELTTAVGTGTTFTVRLPAVVGEVVAITEAGETHPATGSERILLVDDEGGLRRLAAEVLRSAGYVVTPAADGVAALELMELDDEPPHLVVTDVVMPRLGGVELADRLAGVHPGVPVLFMTGYADQASRQGLQHADVLTKPFLVTELVTRVRQALDRAAEGRAALQGTKR